jgi:hypothetical protein
MNYSAEMGLGVIRTKSHKDWFRHSKVNEGGYSHRRKSDFISLLLFFIF